TLYGKLTQIAHGVPSTTAWPPTRASPSLSYDATPDRDASPLIFAGLPEKSFQTSPLRLPNAIVAPAPTSLPTTSLLAADVNTRRATRCPTRFPAGAASSGAACGGSQTSTTRSN